MDNRAYRAWNGSPNYSSRLRDDSIRMCWSQNIPRSTQLGKGLFQLLKPFPVNFKFHFISQSPELKKARCVLMGHHINSHRGIEFGGY